MNKAILSALTAILALGLLAGCQRTAPPSEHINVVMKKYSVDPPVIRIKSGAVVELLVTTPDVQHGFDIPKLGIKEPVQPGKTTSIILNAPPKGEYQIVCGIICGPHHDDMGGKLIVE
jgi:cytochrome c oxidase subunit 2